jgi:hypothetical protein
VDVAPQCLRERAGVVLVVARRHPVTSVQRGCGVWRID